MSGAVPPIYLQDEHRDTCTPFDPGTCTPVHSARTMVYSPQHHLSCTGTISGIQFFARYIAAFRSVPDCVQITTLK